MKTACIAILITTLVVMGQIVEAFEVNVSDASAKRGGVATVSVNFENNLDGDVYAVDLWFRYDHNSFEIQRVEKGAAVVDFELFENFNAEPGLAKIGLAGKHPIDVIQGDLLTFYLKVRPGAVENKEHSFSFDRMKFSSDFAIKDASRIRQGRFTVQK